MKETVEGAARDVQNSIQTNASDFEKSWSETRGDSSTSTSASLPGLEMFPEYKHPKKKWRLKTGATPQWYKARSGTRTRAQSGAARVARFRPVKST